MISRGAAGARRTTCVGGSLMTVWVPTGERQPQPPGAAASRGARCAGPVGASFCRLARAFLSSHARGRLRRSAVEAAGAGGLAAGAPSGSDEVPEGSGLTRTFAIASQKGGVGKTTTAANLSAAWGEAGGRVLAVDFDPQFALSRALGVAPSQAPATVVQLSVRPSVCAGARAPRGSRRPGTRERYVVQQAFTRAANLSAAVT